MDLSRYADLFLSESREHISALNHLLLELERNPRATEPVGAIFRAVHTVKGMSATMGYAAVAELTHEMETLLDRVRRGEVTVTRDLVDLLLSSGDMLESAVELSVQGKVGELDVGATTAKLRSFAAPAGPDALSEVPGGTAEFAVPTAEYAVPRELLAHEGGRSVRVTLLANTALRGARAFLLIKKAESLGRVTSVMPPLAALQAEEFDRHFTLMLESSATDFEIERKMRSVGDVERIEIGDDDAGGPAAVSVPRISVPVEGRSKGTRQARVDVRRLDALMNGIGELVITRGRLQQLAQGVGDSALDETVTQASRLIGELQEEIMLCRMVPVGAVFDRFPRLVRDAARALGKEIHFAVEGTEIELDRSMLDEIGDPIVHLLRNAVDHGIEPPEARIAAGKPPIGRLTLSATRERSSVSIRVADDGRGINRSRVLQKARELDLVPAARGDLSDDEIVRLIARPGFSTAERVTDLSGRGVGIDAVTTRARALGGSVDIRSTPGQGTSVTMRLPVTLAIVRALLARVDDEMYALPMTHVNETVELEPQWLKRVKGKDVLMLRDDVLPLIRFRDVVRMTTTPRGTEQVVVMELGERRAGLVVDALTGQQDIVVKPFDGVRGAVGCFSGATILGDGAPALIVDVASLL